MKHFLSFWITLLIGITAGAQNFKVTLQAPQYKSGIAFLTYHMGKNLNIEDSAAVSSNGTAIFTAKRKLPPGIYAIVLPGKRISVDFFVDKEQQISIKLDTTDLINKTVVTGAKENILFQQYQQYVEVKGKLMEVERQAYLKSTTKKDSTLHEANYLKLNKELNDYREGIVKNNANSMMAVLLNAMKEPQGLNKKMVTRNDSLENYYYYKAHYWDGITLMDDRILRTPFFLPKFEKYYREVLSPQSDSIIKEIDYQLLFARNNQEVYKFMLNWLTDEYMNPKYMGQDAILVHLFEKYHSKGLTSWLNEKQQEAISRRAYMLMSNLIGLKAADLEMIDTAGRPASLYKLAADYTIVVFWDPTCGHCKTELPRLDSIYRASWKKHGVKMYAVLSGDSKEDLKNEWKKYIREHNMADWTNVYQTKEMETAIADAKKPGFRQLYDITLTPTIYLLDKEKRIIGKKLTLEQLHELLLVKWDTKTKLK
jgi:cytochrome oxidase Cu insertion factor (SCO1/SenC/PrrC family)